MNSADFEAVNAFHFVEEEKVEPVKKEIPPFVKRLFGKK